MALLPVLIPQWPLDQLLSPWKVPWIYRRGVGTTVPIGKLCVRVVFPGRFSTINYLIFALEQHWKNSENSNNRKSESSCLYSLSSLLPK
ncbi:hypothetical protein CEXT_770821 [Caerostris extrusa]|uniref:Uncharacterized protein n=1 Tax=Caerostris extrusa TaxID=172846 RepID=A0AAV4P907_CAEEX|nr:hypothetical protein CEXT_770821 [Caerostris extrusa]